MRSINRRLVLVALVAIMGLSLVAAAAQAAPKKIRPGPYKPAPVNYGNYYVAPNLTINQLAYNTSVMGKAYSQIPPYMMGYNPYPQIANYGPSYYNPYASYPNLNSVYSGYYNPYLGSSIYSNPYNPYSAYGYSYLYR